MPCCASGPSLWSEANECYLAELYVVPGRRGGGLGRVLLRACIDRAVARRCDLIDLATSEDDVAARHLYEAELCFLVLGGRGRAAGLLLRARPLSPDVPVGLGSGAPHPGWVMTTGSDLATIG